MISMPDNKACQDLIDSFNQEYKGEFKFSLTGNYSPGGLYSSPFKFTALTIKDIDGRYAWYGPCYDPYIESEQEGLNIIKYFVQDGVPNFREYITKQTTGQTPENKGE